MKKSWLVLLAAVLGIVMNGCGILSQYDNFENSEKLRVGMTKEQVIQIMGEPLDVTFAQPDVWYYYINTRWNDGQTTIDECMPVVFKGGKLAGWGNEYYNRERLIKKQFERPTIDGLQ